VSNFDVPEAAEVGWKFGDEIVEVNHRPVCSREDFRRELAEARKLLPIVFTVKRQLQTETRGRRTIAGVGAKEVKEAKDKDRRKKRQSHSVPAHRPIDTE